MNLFRCILTIAFSFNVIACDRSQPSGIPESASNGAIQAPAPEPASKSPAPAPVQELEAPPPLDGDIPPYAKTGFPDCDSYVEEYRQCLNSRLGGEERKAAAYELTASVNSITANISRGVEPSRIAGRCKKSRKLASKKLEKFGCLMPAP